ncbi:MULTISPECIES: hypothetical protein [Aequorivita]|uniref:DUF4251 domain-containing protein n=2 Tax=Aequorivita TaxID=153265 RepID=A0AB35YU53_9FLAO|nr:hypothetical protein [Aequorivita sp. Ant34-E75]WGF91849.1 hypothetical protein QCQ61_11585 [Aequorivita sp. Ant34-E75]
MKKLFTFIVLFPLIASAQLDFESNKNKLDFVKLPELERLITVPFANSEFSTNSSNTLPSFKLNKNNYREAVSMYDAMAANENYVKSDLKISLDPREYGIYGGNSSYSADGSTAVKNISYKESRGYLRPELMPYSYGFYQRPSRRGGFYVGYGAYGPYSQ